MKVLQRHYPDNIEKQKDLLCALFEAFEGMTKKNISVTTLYKVFKKWNVQSVLWNEISFILVSRDE